MVIHGMGEQRPMDTLRSFVESLFVKDDTVSGKENKVWSVPDQKGLSYELRRLSTPVSNENVRTDFFEFYYADVMSGNTMSQLSAWFWDLLFRRPKHIPVRVILPWFVLWLLTLLVATAFAITFDIRAYVPGAAGWKAVSDIPWFIWTPIAIFLLVVLGLVYRALPDLRALAALTVSVIAAGIMVRLLTYDPSGIERFAAAMIGAAVTLMSSFALRYFGDVARYVRATPDNVQARHQIRERGLAFLEGLHDGTYERIVVIAHSLGTIVAYDLLNLLWQKIGPTINNPPPPAVVRSLRRIDDFLPENLQKQAFDLDSYRAAQWQVFEALRASPPSEPGKRRWLVSDFITLGSPLTHADFLVERSADDFERAERELELPVSPPVSNKAPVNVYAAPKDIEKKHGNSILYVDLGTGLTVTHHAAVFAAVRWTNIYDPRSWILFGDLISGPVATQKKVPGFGPGIDDVKVRMTRWDPWAGPFRRVFTHTLYGLWQRRFEKNKQDFGHILELRKAVDLNAIGTGKVPGETSRAGKRK